MYRRILTIAALVEKYEGLFTKQGIHFSNDFYVF